VSGLALVTITALALVLCYLIARPFVTSLAWATALAVVSAPLHRRVARRITWPSAAAAVSVAAVALLLIVPSALVIPRVIDEAVIGFNVFRTQIESNMWNEALARHAWIAPAWDWLRQRFDLGDLLRQTAAALTAIGTFAVRTSLVRLIEFVLTFFFLFYFLRDRDTLLASIRRLLPLAPAEADTIFRTVGDTIFATLYGKMLVGIVQGALGGMMFWWLGLPAAWFWAIMMALLSIIPLLGPPVVWVPAALYLLINGDLAHALLLAIWGAAVVGLADNLLYPIFVGRYLRMHTVPLLISMIGGVVIFGTAGLFLGPVALAVTLATLEIWRARAACE